LTANANVQLLDLDGRVIQSSANAGTTAELINTTLNAGAYRIRVTSASDTGTPFNLAVFATPLLEGVTTTGSEAPIYLSTRESLPLIEVDDFRSGNPALDSDPRFVGINGRGFSAVIIDTGINLNHPFFGSDSNRDGIADRIIFNADYANHDRDATDFDGHGTNVASIVASQDITHPGVAPGASIVALKVFKDSGEGSFAYTEQALQWVLENAEERNIASVNLSLGDGGNYFTVQQLHGISDELAALARRGVIVASASGNSYFNFEAQGVQYPAADPNSLSVGACLTDKIQAAPPPPMPNDAGCAVSTPCRAMNPTVAFDSNPKMLGCNSSRRQHINAVSAKSQSAKKQTDTPGATKRAVRFNIA
jgi:subtilisin family serine protease